MVFDPALVKYQEREAFIEWYYETTEWEGDHDYFDPVSGSEPLRGWFADIIVTYPPMNGPLAPSLEQVDDFDVADYSISPDSIYVAFAWSDADRGFNAAVELAAKHKLGFFEVSGQEGAVWVPDETGKMVRVH